jgi:uncharacterized membrane protein
MKGEDMDTSGISQCEAMPMLVAVIVALGVLVGLILTIAIIWIYCKIFAKAGYCWALGLLMLVPIVNIIMLCVLAMGDWPVLNELRRLKQQAQADAGHQAQGQVQGEPDEQTRED